MINYYLITKPGILIGNLITLAAGFFLASQGIGFHPMLFVTTSLGLAFVMASACVFNNYIDRERDRKMERTKNRVLVKGTLSTRKALLFASLLGLAGAVVLFLFTNLLTLSLALFGFFIYVVVYSLWKARTVYGTAIGSIAGSVPPLVGYCAVSDQLDLGGLLLFLFLVFWQMPHFFSIAIYRLNDYKAASIPVLPLVKGMYRTKLHMLLYIFIFTLISFNLTLLGYTNLLFLGLSFVLGGGWLYLCLKGFKGKDETLWARHMFRLSLVIITILSLAIIL